MKENVKEEVKIPQPVKGAAGNRFCLQTAMLLQDNKPLYAALCVSLCLFCLGSYLSSLFTALCSQPQRPGWPQLFCFVALSTQRKDQ